MKSLGQDMHLTRSNAARLVLMLDLASIAPVLIIAFVVNALSLFADSLTYINNISVNLVAWLTLRRIARGKSIGYDYGLGKLETLTSLVCSLAIMGGLAGILFYSFERLIRPSSLRLEWTWLGVAQYIIELGFCLWLWRRNRRIARAGHSPIMETIWRANRGDAMQSIGIILTLSLSSLFRECRWAVYLDPVCAIAISATVMASFLHIVRGSLSDLLDRTIEEDLQLRIMRQFADHFDEYANLQAVRTRRSGGRIFIDADMELDSAKTVAEAKEIMRRISSAIEASIPGSTVRISLATSTIEAKQ